MKNSWINGLDEDEVKDIKTLFIQSRRLRNRLDEICEQKIRQSYKSSKSTDKYDKPNWPLYQADHIGYVRALHEIKSLIENLKE